MLEVEETSCGMLVVGTETDAVKNQIPFYCEKPKDGPMSLTIVFIDSTGCQRPVTFTVDHLGIALMGTTPAIVAKVMVQSQAEELGVEVGWTLVEVEDQNVADLDGKQVARIISQLPSMDAAPERYPRAVEPCADGAPDMFTWKLQGDARVPSSVISPGASLSMGFEVEGNVTTVEFTRGPLGIVFTRSKPFEVDSVTPHSHAAMKGVQPGWRLVQLAGQDVAVKEARDQDVTVQDWEEVVKTIVVCGRTLPR